MSTQDIRLRLTIRRHGVPDVKLLWPCTATDDLTISKLLANINEVVPLESEHWGLEDYSVELADGHGGSFECLHFQPVAKVLKQDDQVLIRSLLTDDLKRRLLSGRHQISSSGMHLVDGVAFGRPWLRAPRDRPAVNLPPRKRARLEYNQSPEDDENIELEEPAQQLLLMESTGDEGQGFLGTSDEEDQEYMADEAANVDHDVESDDEAIDDEENLEEELRFLQQDNDVIGDNFEDQLALGSGTSNAANLTPTFAPEMNAGILAPTVDNRATLLEDDQDAEDQAALDGIMDMVRTIRARAAETVTEVQRPLIEEVEADSHQTTLIQAESEEVSDRDDASSSSASSSDSSSDSSSGENDESEADSDEDSLASLDDNSESDETSSDNSDEMESIPADNTWNGIEPMEEDSGDTDKSSVDDNDSVLQDGGASLKVRPTKRAKKTRVSSPESSDDSSTSDSSNSESGSDDSSSSEDDSSDSSSDDSHSIPEPYEISAKPSPANTMKKAPVKAKTKVFTATQAAIATQPSQSGDPSQSAVSSGQGLSRTQKRNARRRSLKNHMLMATRQSESTQAEPSVTVDAELMARKQALLAAVAADNPQQSESAAPLSEGQPQQGVSLVTEPTESSSPMKNSGEADRASSQDGPPRRRLRMDMGAGRRLLFGALGLKNPKTKADEEKLKTDLMQDVRPLKNHRQAAKVDDAKVDEEAAPEPEADLDSWKDKITYRAVECCRDGVMLSKPPFPFVQRWDPQQQHGLMRKRKRSSQNFYPGDYDQEDWNYNHGTVDPFGNDSSQPTAEKSRGEEPEQGSSMEAGLNYCEPPAPKLGDNSQFTDIDDLPSLPQDVSTLHALQASDVKPGMVITWKELLLSKATNWQPQLSSVTGLVVFLDNDQVLHVVLAKRDRDHIDKAYDEETGKRIYDKFEMPSDSENDDGGEDDGQRELSWSELIDPRLVQAEPPPGLLASPGKPGTSTSQQNGDDAGKMAMAQTSAIESGAEGLDSMDVDSEQQVPDSASIPSGQNGMNLDFSAPSVEAPTASSDESRERISQTESVDDQPAAQSSHQDSSSQVRVFMSSLLETRHESNTPGPASASNEVSVQQVDSAMSEVVESESDAVYQDAAPSFDDKASSSSSPPSSSDNDDGQLTPTAGERVQMTEPSSATSLRSGRQPQSNGDVGVALNEDAIIADTNPLAHETTPKPRAPTSAKVSLRESSPPFPSIDEIWHTATTSRQAQSPLKSSQMSAVQKVKLKKDDEYEAAMQKFDEGDESDSLPDLKNKSIRSLFPNATQPSPSLERSSHPADRSQRTGSPFKIPEGSQIISLTSSSSASPIFEENYADDSVDGTYMGGEDEGSSLPHGSGWVQKNKSSKSARQKRGKSLPSATPTAAAMSTRPGRKSLIPSSSASGAFGRRKSSGRKF